MSQQRSASSGLSKVLRASSVLLIALTCSFMSAESHADSWRFGGGFDSHRGYSGYRQSGRHYDFRGNRSWYGSSRYHRHYSSHRYNRNNYFSVSLGHSNRWRHGRHYGYSHYNSDAAAVLGGVILGSVITSSFRNNRDYGSGYKREYRREPTVTRVVRSSRPVASVSSSAPRLLRDLQGNCFQIDYDNNGNQQRVQVDDSRCLY